MSTQDDKTIAWQGRIQERAAHATKAILDRLATMPKSGLNNLSPIERRDLSETIAKQIVDTMATLGTFVTAGAQDFQVCHLEVINIGKGGKTKMTLIPQASESGGINLQMLAANADKQVVVAMINGLAYSQAREALSKAIHREQTDWVQRSHDDDMTQAERETSAELESENEGRQPAEQEAQPEPEQEAIGVTDNEQPTSELIAEQPGDDDHGDQKAPAEAGEDRGASTGSGSAGELGSSEASGAGERAAEDGSTAGAVPTADSGSAEGPNPDRDSPLARAGRRVRRKPAGDGRPTAH